ncbi:Lactate utilization protein A [bioreactor metagenome]|uniref:Lactate utilization protein A n=1 Tax=bioreactor metagenome TaxID=1076179 RepID=A0A645GRQ9_9ZZZZ
MVKDYAYALKGDEHYAEKAARISAMARDLCELLPQMLPELADKLQGRVQKIKGKMAYHPPCTLQHAQRLKGVVERDLAKLGFQMLVSRTESHLCCGSAGTYSILQPELSKKLRARKLAALDEACGEEKPALILSSNVGCITHLQSGTDVPVKHWVEVLDEALV